MFSVVDGRKSPALIDQIVQLRQEVWNAEGATDVTAAIDPVDAMSWHVVVERAGKVEGAGRVCFYKTEDEVPLRERFGHSGGPVVPGKIAVLSHLVVREGSRHQGYACRIDELRISLAKKRHASWVFVDAPRKRVNSLLPYGFQLAQIHGSGPPPFEWRSTTWAAMRLDLRAGVWGYAVRCLLALMIFGLCFIAVRQLAEGHWALGAIVGLGAAVIWLIGRRGAWLVIAMGILTLYGWDSLIIGVTVGMAVVMEFASWCSVRSSGALDRLWLVRPGRMNLLTLFLWWVCITLGMMLQGAAVTPVLGDPPRATGAGVAVALSGGGYRAALFHVGVVSQLSAEGIVPDVVSGVSGGAIAAAHFVSGGDPARFSQIAALGELRLTRRILRMDTVLRMVFVPGGRTRVNADMLSDRLLGDMLLADLDARAPLLLLCTTDLLTGAAVGWLHAGCVMHACPRMGGEASRAIGKETVVYCSGGAKSVGGGLRLADVVAASAAFPAVFDPFAIGLMSGDAVAQRFALADGGLLDNSGVGLLLATIWLSRSGEGIPGSTEVIKARDVRIVVESDASQILEGTPDAPGVLGAIVRSGDVAYGEAQAGSMFRASAEAKQLNVRIVRVTPHVFWRSRPLQGMAELKELRDAVVIADSSSDLARRIVSEEADGQGSLLQVMQEKMIDIAIREYLVELSLKALRRMIVVGGDDGYGYTDEQLGKDLEEAKMQVVEEVRRRSVTQGVPNRRLMTIDDPGLRKYLSVTPERFRSSVIELLYDDLRLCYGAFCRMTTLDDAASEEEIAQVVRLGRYMACGALDEIETR